MPVGHVAAALEQGRREEAVDKVERDDLVPHAERLGLVGGTLVLALGVLLPVVERDRADELVLAVRPVQHSDAVHPAGEEDDHLLLRRRRGGDAPRGCDREARLRVCHLPHSTMSDVVRWLALVHTARRTETHVTRAQRGRCRSGERPV